MKKYKGQNLTTKHNKSIRDKLIMIFTWLFLLFFGIILLNTIFYNSNTIIHYDMRISTIIGSAILFALMGIYYIVNRYKENLSKLRQKKYLSIIFFIIISLLIFFCQVFLAKATYFEQGWDCRMLINSGMNLVVNAADVDVGYFRMFPNNTFLVLIFKNVFKVSQVLGFLNYRFLLIVINIIVIDITVVLILLICRKIFGKRLMIISYILALMILLFSPWIDVPYSDTLSMIFPVLIYYIYLKAKECKNKIKKAVLLFIIGVVGLIGFQIKPTVIIIIIAIIISYGMNNVKNKKDIIKYFAVIALISMGFVSSKLIYNNKVRDFNINGVRIQENNTLEIPITHFLMMGMQSRYGEGDGMLYGAWALEDYNITLGQPSKEQKIRANLSEIKKRLKEFGVRGYSTFLFYKANWILCDGTFYYGGEGSFMVSEPYSTDDISKTLQRYFIVSGQDYTKLAHFNEGIWVAMLMFIVFPLFIRKKGIDGEDIFIIRSTIIGIIIFILLLEGRSRYLINYVPFFILLATYGADVLYNSVKSIVCRETNNKRL